jgi:hypothetical protein
MMENTQRLGRSLGYPRCKQKHGHKQSASPKPSSAQCHAPDPDEGAFSHGAGRINKRLRLKVV